VLFNILSSENTLFLKKSRLELNGGIHSNLRLENEGGNHISLNMFLNTVTYNARWFTTIGRNTELVLGNESQYQVNTNYGSRVIVPDANLFETALSGYIKKKWKLIDFETGLSLSERNVTTKFTKNMDYLSGAIYPFSNWYPSLNGNAGVALNTLSNWNIKLNAGTGYRSANLAELSSNGLHEGTSRYEVGNPKMKAEQNLNVEMNVNYESDLIDFYSAVYLNMFKNYIYLAPTGTEYFGYDIYRFLQGNARLYGSEISIKIKPFEHVSFQSSYSTVTGKLTSSDYLPFIAPPKIVADVTVKPSSNFTCKMGADFVSKQDHLGDFETATAVYWLLHTSLRFVIHTRKTEIRLSVNGDNLLNKTYFDHLSRFKYFGIYNMGRNIMTSVSLPFNRSTKR
jgi:iron complex outermembrane receptor protein